MLGNPDGVEGNVDRGSLVDDRVQVARDRLLVKRVNLCCVGCPAGHADFLRKYVDGLQVSSGEKDMCAFARESMGHCPADCTCRSVDDSVLVVEQHRCSPFAVERRLSLWLWSGGVHGSF